jgi:hypothetical protein
MRAVPLALVLATGTAHADRVPVITLGATLDLRFAGKTWDIAETKQQPDAFGGGEVMLAFEERPLPLTPMGKVAGECRLVPELIAGALTGDRYAEGYVGAGVRAELHVAGPKANAGFYIGGRGLVIGANRNSAAEFVVGDYIMAGPKMMRFGVEGGAMIRPEDRDGNHDLDVTMRLYAGWRL